MYVYYDVYGYASELEAENFEDATMEAARIENLANPKYLRGYVEEVSPELFNIRSYNAWIRRKYESEGDIDDVF